ncbi:MAG: hypothetical protein AAFY58_01235 [Planctomycetota bacterium]
MRTTTTSMLAIAVMAGTAFATGAGDVNGLDDAPRLFNDFSGSNLTLNSNWTAGVGNVSIVENNYGAGGFANKHISFFADAPAGNRVDFDYGDGFDAMMTLQVNGADNVGNLETGFNSDLFGFGLFGVLTANGEIAAFGGTMPFHSFGPGVYNVGDEVMLNMIYTPGAGENMMPASTIEYRYNNLTTGSGWVSSGLVSFGNTEGGWPSAFTQTFGVGAQINNPDAVNGAVDVDFRNITIIPAPASAALLGLAGIAGIRRRR